MYVVFDTFNKPLLVAALCDEHYSNPEDRCYATMSARAAVTKKSGDPVWTEVDLVLPCVTCFISEKELAYRAAFPYLPSSPLEDWEKELLAI
jgi:hypothetical protein